MICEARLCRENNEGYCMAASYVTINPTGECEMYEPIVKHEERDDKDDED